MELKSKTLVLVFFTFVTAIVVFAFHNIVLQADFLVYDYVSCDPTIESCFVYCDSECYYDDPYKKIEKEGENIPICNPITSDCPELTCEPGEEDCAIYECSADTLETGERCFMHHSRFMPQGIGFE